MCADPTLTSSPSSLPPILLLLTEPLPTASLSPVLATVYQVTAPLPVEQLICSRERCSFEVWQLKIGVIHI